MGETAKRRVSGGNGSGPPRDRVGVLIAPRRAIRVLLLDDGEVYRAGLHSVLNEQHDISVIGEIASLTELREAALHDSPDVVVTSLHQTEEAGVSSVSGIRETWPHAAILILTNAADETLALQAYGAGASAYIFKDSSPDRITAAILAVHAGVICLEPMIAQRLAPDLLAIYHRRTGRSPHESLSTALSHRELDVLRMWAGGADTREIADKLYISQSTVRVHIAHILRKAGLRHRTDAVRVAIREGLVDA